ncbi:MAG: serine/threonine protein kinase [Planctomycetota bacterium]
MASRIAQLPDEYQRTDKKQPSEGLPLLNPFQRITRNLFTRHPIAVVIAVGLFTFVLLLVVSSLIASPLRGSLRQQAGRTLEAKLRGDISEINRWIAARYGDARRFPESSLSRIQQVLSGEEIQLSDIDLPSDRYIGWAVFDSERKVLQTNLQQLEQLRLPISDSVWNRLAERDPIIAWPFPSPISPSQRSDSQDALMGVVQPLVDGGRPLGGIILLLDPQNEFKALLSSVALGETGESIAFNESAQLISPSRFESDLRAAGKLNKNSSSVVSFSLRRNDGSLTVIADQATRGGSGSSITGIPDYRGTDVMAAWQWIPEEGIGVATKMDVAEVMQSWTWLWRGWAATLIVLMTFACFVCIRVGKTQSTAGDDATRRLGQYALQERVGKGGMGAVYRGSHKLLRRDVAIKVLEADELSPQAALRFEREVQMTAQLRHPNTIAIYDYGRTDDGTFFYVMEFVDGITLQELVDHFGPQPPGRVIHLMLQICGAMGEAHQQGLIHRDIKPSNILVTARAGLYDMIKVLDFGLVKSVHSDTRELTHTDGITGTPMYMSPESVRDAAMADQRSDLYSVGAVGYTLLTGKPTFDGDSSVDVCLKQLKEMPLRPAERLGEPLPEDLQNVLMSCLQKDPEERPRSIEDLQSALRQCESKEWVVADAIHWWEVTYASHDKNPESKTNDRTDGTGKPSSGTTAKT